MRMIMMIFMIDIMMVVIRDGDYKNVKNCVIAVTLLPDNLRQIIKEARKPLS